jgi:uncharacterized protein DUF6455
MAIQTRTYPIVESVINLLGDRFKHRQEMRELREINDSDFARIAQDLGVTSAELDTLARRGPHASDELPKLLKSLGFDEATLSRTEPRLQRDMVRVCASCGQKTRCDHDLDAGTSAQHYTEYCPNAPAIEELGPKA